METSRNSFTQVYWKEIYKTDADNLKGYCTDIC